MRDTESLVAEIQALRENLEKEIRLRKETEEREEMNVKELKSVRSQLENERSKNTAVDPVYLHFVDSSEISPESYKAVSYYKELADRILNDHDARTFIHALVDELMNGTKKYVFNALCVPSGTGKTQLAFSFPKERYECVYLNMDVLSSESLGHQSVYNAFAGHMGPFLSWLTQDHKDSPISDVSTLRIYTFLHALMKLLTRLPEIHLPGDLSRLRISRTLPAGESQQIADYATSGMVRLEIENYLKSRGKKQMVIFVDEFASTERVPQDVLAFLCRNLLHIGVCVIVASTDSGALSMSNSMTTTAASRGRDAPWVNLCTRLPKYVPPPSLRDALDRCPDSRIKTVLELCLQSRPLFVESVAAKIEAYLAKSSRRLSSDFVAMIDEIREDLVAVLRSKVTAGLPEGCFGYVTAMLLAGGALISADEAHIRLFGNLTTKNWAYLVHDPIVLSDGAPTVDAAKRARLQTSSGASESQDRFMRMSIKQHPSEDFLFYLVLAGSRMSPGLEVFDNAGCRRRVSLAALLNTVFNKKLPFSGNDIVPSFAYHEALVCAAFYTACNSGSLSGCSLEELLTRFVAELMVPFNSSYPKLTKVDKIPLVGQEFSARFVFPFDTSLPNEVHQILHTAQVSRPATGECVDVATFIPNGSATKSYQVIVVAKSTTKPEYVKERIKRALNRQDFNAKVSFIVVDGILDQDMMFNPEDFQVVSGGSLSTRVFRVEVDDSLKVELFGIFSSIGRGQYQQIHPSISEWLRS